MNRELFPGAQMPGSYPQPPAEMVGQLGQASVDLRLGYSFTRLQNLPGITLSVAEGLPSLGASGFWNTNCLTPCVPGVERPDDVKTRLVRTRCAGTSARRHGADGNRRKR